MKDSRLFNSVKEQVDKFDAYALLEGGCPDDEDRPFNAEEFSDAAQKIKKVLDSL